jgi:hypothetical protein
VARNYPDEPHDGHIMPDLQTWDANPMNAGYTQVVQRRGGAAKTERIDVATLNAKFDEVYQRGGIYNFMSHPQWLDYGPDGFYERHLQHVGRRRDVWYVPMGPLYAYRTMVEKAEVKQLAASGDRTRFQLSCALDPKIYSGSLTLEFLAPTIHSIAVDGEKLQDHGEGLTDRWDRQYFRRENEHLYATVHCNTVLEFQ